MTQKNRNPMRAALSSPLFRQRKIKNRKREINKTACRRVDFTMTKNGGRKLPPSLFYITKQ